MSEEKINLIGEVYNAYSEDRLDIAEESGLINNAKEVDVVDNGDFEYESMLCSDFEIDLKNKCINFSVVEMVHYSQTIYYTINFDKVDFNRFFISLVKHLEINALKNVIRKIFECVELKDKFCKFIEIGLNEFSDKEKVKLGKILLKYDNVLASKLLI